MSEVLLSHILPHLDMAPVNRSTRSQVSNPFYWRTKLDNLGYLHDDQGIEYRSVYIALKENDFDVDLTYLKACESGDAPLAEYLSHYVEQAVYEECVNRTNSGRVIDITHLNVSEADRVILKSLGDMRKLKKLLRKYNPVNIAPLVVGSLIVSPEAQALVASSLSRKELRKYFDGVNSRELALVYEENGFKFHIDKAVEYGLPVSVQYFLDGEPSQTAIREWLETAIETNHAEVVSLLVSYAQFNLEYLLVICARKNLYEFCRAMALNGVVVYKGVIEAIKYANNTVCETLLPFSDLKDLDTYMRLAKSLGNTKLCNTIISMKSGVRTRGV